MDTKTILLVGEDNPDDEALTLHKNNVPSEMNETPPGQGGRS